MKSTQKEEMKADPYHCSILAGFIINYNPDKKVSDKEVNLKISLRKNFK